MKKHLPVALFTFLYLSTLPENGFSQCGMGTTRDTLNWDYLDFLPNSGAYVTPIPFVTLTQSQEQDFTFGKLTVRVNHNYSGNNVMGDVTTHTGEPGSFGLGADICFRNDGSVSFTFSQPVNDLKFSVYDIDFGQSIDITAFDGANPALINSSVLAGSILAVTGNGSSNLQAVSALSPVSATAITPAANGTLNVEIPGPVTTITITATQSGTTTGEDGSFYISDLSACAPGLFPLNYYSVAKPFDGQPSYFLAVMNNRVFYVDIASGVARLLFQDNGHTNINSLAYDPYRHMVYYSYSLTTSAQTDRKIFRYDYDMDTLGVMLPNVNSLGIITYQTGVESGAAGFYDGAYYLGIEGNDGGGYTSNRESIIWRIDFDSAFNPVKAAQVWATPVDDGSGTPLHDWSDVGFNDGIMYDFDGASNRTDFYHKDLLTGSCDNIKPVPSSLIPRQVSVSWAGQMYNSGSPGSSASGTLAPYLGDGSVNTSLQRTMTYQGVAVVGSWGDAGEAFKPKTDFGDAPASYDPAGVDPGTHERNDSIRLGNTMGIEWQKRTSIDATGDGAEEDAVTGIQVIPTGISNYFLYVQVYNVTGRNAIVAGWIDANGDGMYEPSEGTTATVASAAGIQTVGLLWTGINVTIPLYSSTFMRLRIATVDQGLTVSKPNGYLDNGEIEDHTITSSLVLPDQKLNLFAKYLTDGKVNLTWKVNHETDLKKYMLETSSDAVSWKVLLQRDALDINNASYAAIDNAPFSPIVYYRIKSIKNSGSYSYSETVRLQSQKGLSISVSPNPVQDWAWLRLHSPVTGKARVMVYDQQGRLLLEKQLQVMPGDNMQGLNEFAKFASGKYEIIVKLGDEIAKVSVIVGKR